MHYSLRGPVVNLNRYYGLVFDHALSIGRNLPEKVDDVRFVNCGVIHDKGSEWTLGTLFLAVLG